MTGILDRIAWAARPPYPRQFKPVMPQHLVALRLAQQVNDAPAVQHYVDLLDRLPLARVVAAYRVAMRSNADDPARQFHTELKILRPTPGRIPERDIAGIRIERRAIAVAILHGQRLKYPPIAHQLSSDSTKVLGSVALFINRVLDRCSFTNAALEAPPADQRLQRSQLARIVADVLVQRQVAIWQYPKTEVLACFGHPPLRFRKDVRDVMTAMWPEVNGGFGSPLMKDALALGLYCFVEHLLNIQQ